jgi:hypothetical protein
MKVVIPYKPRDVFKPLHARKERWAVVVAHRRAGKSVACINELIKCACTDSSGDGRYAYICPYYSQAKQVIWDYCKTFTKPIPNIIGSQLYGRMLSVLRWLTAKGGR